MNKTTQVDQNREDEDNSLPKLKRETETVPFTVGEVKPREIGSLDEDDGRISQAQSDVQPKDTKSLPFVVVHKAGNVMSHEITEAGFAELAKCGVEYVKDLNIWKANDTFSKTSKNKGMWHCVVCDSTRIPVGGTIEYGFAPRFAVCKKHQEFLFLSANIRHTSVTDLVKENPDDK